jgi:hypothetical protein
MTSTVTAVTASVGLLQTSMKIWIYPQSMMPDQQDIQYAIKNGCGLDIFWNPSSLLPSHLTFILSC